jgi:hypothetical protein
MPSAKETAHNRLTRVSKDTLPSIFMVAQISGRQVGAAVADPIFPAQNKARDVTVLYHGWQGAVSAGIIATR